MTDEEKNEIIHKMDKECKRIQRRLGAEACVVIGMFKNGDELMFQDVGNFPMPPEHFYTIMIQAHKQGKMTLTSKPKLIIPH